MQTWFIYVKLVKFLPIGMLNDKGFGVYINIYGWTNLCACKCKIIWKQGDKKKTSFRKLRLFFSFGDRFKAFKSKYACMFAIDLCIEPKDE